MLRGDYSCYSQYAQMDRHEQKKKDNTLYIHFAG